MRKLLLSQFKLNLKFELSENDRLLVAMPDAGDKANNYVPMKNANGDYIIPGSSLKGVFRSRAEYIANLIHNGNGVCHIFDRINDSDPKLTTSCGDRFDVRMKAAEKSKQVLPSAALFTDACPACQLFGHSAFKGRLTITDFIAQSSGARNLVSQTHIAIDRLSGAVASSKTFTQDYVKNNQFIGTITIHNFAIWQLGWLGMVLQDLQDGIIHVGHKQTSGYGKLSIIEENAEIRYFAKAPEKDTVLGIGNLVKPNIAQSYGLATEEVKVDGVQWHSDDPLWYSADFSMDIGNSLEQLWNQSRGFAYHHLKGFDFCQEMQIPVLLQLLGSREESIS